MTLWELLLCVNEWYPQEQGDQMRDRSKKMIGGCYKDKTQSGSVYH